MSEKIIITNPEDLKVIISEIMSDIINLSPKELPDNLTLADTIVFLREQGYPVSKSQLYQLTSKSRIPYKKFGKRLVFSRVALFKWLKDESREPYNWEWDDIEGINEVAASARRKINSGH